MTINQEIRGAETPRAQKVMAVGGILGASRSRLAAFCRWRSAIRHDLAADDLKSTMFAYPTGASDVSSML